MCCHQILVRVRRRRRKLESVGKRRRRRRKREGGNRTGGGKEEGIYILKVGVEFCGRGCGKAHCPTWGHSCHSENETDLPPVNLLLLPPFLITSGTVFLCSFPSSPSSFFYSAVCDPPPPSLPFPLLKNIRYRPSSSLSSSLSLSMFGSAGQAGSPISDLAFWYFCCPSPRNSHLIFFIFRMKRFLFQCQKSTSHKLNRKLVLRLPKIPYSFVGSAECV